MAIPNIPMNSCTSIPQIGLGTWPLDDAEVEAAIIAAVELGYRHIDTGEKYGNEVGVGRGIRASGLDRDEFFVTTKLDGEFQGDDRAIAGLDGCLERLGLEYVDLLMIHWPLPARDEYVSTWRTFEKLLATGRVQAIGVSNFTPAHLQRLIDETGVVPAVNQVQLNPYVPRLEHRTFHLAHGIVTEAWSPLGSGEGLLDEPVLARIGQEHGATPAQVVLRWHVQLGNAAVPKSRTRARLAENIDVFGFELTDDEMAAITALSEGAAPGVDADREGH